VRRPALLVVLLGLVVLTRRKAAATRAERELWAEAGVAPDLR
jgi:hypothetical protein